MGLLCWQRSGLDNNVPGCGGSAAEHVDYCYDPHLVTKEVIATIPATSLTATDSPSNRPTTAAPTRTPTLPLSQTPTLTNGDAVWDAFMAMVNNYANAKKVSLVVEESPDPPSQNPTTDGISSAQPTTAFHAVWNEGMQSWKSSRTVQNDATDYP